jgi:hypothetical protein
VSSDNNVTANVLRTDVITSNGRPAPSSISLADHLRELTVLHRYRLFWVRLGYSGVIHVIDKFLANPDYNGQAAASA